MRACLKVWEGTPHKDRMAKVGVGIDCIGLVAEVFVAAGQIERFTFPFYKTSWGYGRRNNLMERMLCMCCHAEVAETPESGDVVIFAVGRQTNHCGVVMDGKVWHAFAGNVVRADALSDHIKRIQSFVRLTAPGFRKRPEELTTSDMITE